MADKTPSQATEHREAEDPGQDGSDRPRRRARGKPPGESKIADNPLARAFGARLREVRLEADIAQDVLAELSGLHRTEVSLIERGGREPRLATMLKLAGGLGVAPMELVGGVAIWCPEGLAAKELMRERALRWAETGSAGKVGSGALAKPQGKVMGQSVAALFGHRVRELRKRGDLSQEELGVLAGMHRTELSSLERGEREPRLANVLKLAGGIGVDPAVLLEVLPALDPEGIPKKAGQPPRSDEPPGTPDAPTRDPETRMPARADRLPANGGTLIVAPAYQVGLARSAIAGRSFSDKVVSLREERGWTQRELAIRAGVARTEITKVELGARLPPADVVLRLASGFDLGPGDLLEGIPPGALPPDTRMLQRASPIEEPPAEDEADLADRLARNLVTLRRRRGLSQSDLARASGVDRDRINGFEEKTTMPQVVTLGKLAGALSVPVSTLIDGLLPDDDRVGVR